MSNFCDFFLLKTGKDPWKSSSITMETVTFEDVAVKFTPAEWDLLTPSQKKLYRRVMWETYMNITATRRIWNNQQIKEEDKNCSGSIR
ncbi:putative KRAB domain-containing protein ZNF788 [Cavia porcellus]|uniref:putative KRAB domain-containing protein ZNF788 n=1 Tax=Cavia porcellus TaxID=10141 RepID=UPI002FE1122B